MWGVPIPALHHKHSDRVVLDNKSLDYILDAMEYKNLDWWTAPIEHFVPPWLSEEGQTAAETWEKGQDTMDVWFDSGTSWSMLVEMGVGKNQESGRKVHADLCLEGSDQHRGWFQSQLLTALGSASSSEEKTSPYGSLITHGMVLDEQGRKMSKSLGNVVKPMTVIQQVSCAVIFGLPRFTPCRVPTFCGCGLPQSIIGKTCLSAGLCFPRSPSH